MLCGCLIVLQGAGVKSPGDGGVFPANPVPRLSVLVRCVTTANRKPVGSVGSCSAPTGEDNYTNASATNVGSLLSKH